jgi:DNA adenine methylase
MPDALPRLFPPLKWHGGKYYLAAKIVALMPPHTHYVEPYAGGLSVLLAKDPEGVSEVVNDLNGQLMTFWRVLQEEVAFSRFKRILDAVPFSEVEWQGSRNATGEDPVKCAVQFFIFCRQSLAGRMDRFAPLSRNRTRRGMNEQASAWMNAVDGLAAVHSRLRRVVILNRDALDVIREQDGPETLFYLDPPYLGETRTSEGVYAHEMTEDQHAQLLGVICRCKGKVLLSGYPSDLYTRQLSNWNRHDIEIPNQAAWGKAKRVMTEVVWRNF